MDIGVIQAKAEEVFILMGERLSVKGGDLSARTKKAGRLLPKRIRNDARFLADASALVENPKLIRMVDPSRVDAAHRSCMRHLKTIDSTARRKDLLLSIGGGVGMAVFVVAGMSITILVWRGYL